MSALTFSLIAMHAGAVYIVDSNLSESDCVALTERGAITELELSAGVFIRPESIERFACNVELPTPQPTHVPGNGGLVDRLDRHHATPHQTRYGQPVEFWNANPVEPPGFKRRKASKHGGKTTRGRPRKNAD